MAFPDWPTSDGHNMISYPVLQDWNDPERLSEHTHRLAGLVIGLTTILLVGLCALREKWNWVTRTSLVILVAVIGQGLLGGLRVIQNEQLLALTHSLTGALFFTLCCVFAYATWRTVANTDGTDQRLGPMGAGLIAILPFAVLAQYALGSNFRHRQLYLNEHVLGAIIVSLLTFATMFVLLRSSLPRIRRAGLFLSLAILFQICLGLGAYVTKLGFPRWNISAMLGSWQQSAVCSAHTVGGMLLLVSSSIAVFEVVCYARNGQLTGLKTTYEPLRTDGGLT